MPAPRARPRAFAAPRRGFGLIELMIAVAILAIVVGVALPSFMDSMRKSRRAEAAAAIAAVQQAQERWRGSKSSYADNLTASPTATPPGLGISATTPNGRYSLALANVTATGYEVTATALGAQAEDTRCKLLGAQQAGGQLRYGSGTDSIDWADPNGCWAK